MSVTVGPAAPSHGPLNIKDAQISRWSGAGPGRVWGDCSGTIVHNPLGLLTFRIKSLSLPQCLASRPTGLPWGEQNELHLPYNFARWAEAAGPAPEKLPGNP